MTVGKTHSGKTTFGYKIAKKLKQHCLLDSDILAEFLREYVPDLYKNDFVKNSNKISSGYNLKKKILTEIYKHALKTNIPIIITSANQTKKIRKEIYLLSKKEKRKFILVYFDLPEKILIRDYIRKMRIRDEELGKGWGQIVTPLFIDTIGGKQELNCANTEGIL
ncbi:MAG: AAA family ATPase [Patescibacteria group bacterium]|nr:AAA family ATPase [Patescibacteria group bacterium]